MVPEASFNTADELSEQAQLSSGTFPRTSRGSLDSRKISEMNKSNRSRCGALAVIPRHASMFPSALVHRIQKGTMSGVDAQGL